MRPHGGRGDRGRSVFEGFQVVDDVVSNESAAAKRSPVHHGDAERRMEVFVLRQLLESRRVGDDPKRKSQEVQVKKFNES